MLNVSIYIYIHTHICVNVSTILNTRQSFRKSTPHEELKFVISSAIVPALIPEPVS